MHFFTKPIPSCTLVLGILIPILLGGCANTLNSRDREDMSAQPPRFEVPYDQIPQSVDEQYMLNYQNRTLSDTENEMPQPIQIYPENYRTENRVPRVSEGTSRPLEAIPAPNKEGFVISPYAPDAGLVDVREFGPGMEVRDPYTGRVMLVPVNTGKTPPPEINREANQEATGSPILQRAPAPNPGLQPAIAPGPPMNVQ